MDEARRQTYLTALGVDLYQARQPLPYAAPSVFPEWEAEAQWLEETNLPAEDGHELGVAALSPGLTASPAGNVAASVASLVGETSATKPREAGVSSGGGGEPFSGVAADLPVPVLRNLRPMVAPSPAAESVSASRMRIGLTVIEWPGKLRVLLDMSDPDAPSLSAREHRLWSEISLALWGREQAYSGQSVPVFRFPPTAKLKHLENPVAIRDAVDGFLLARQGRMTVPMHVMFAGDGLVQAYLANAQGELTGNVTLAGVGEMLLLPSLSRILADGRLKPGVWSALAAACLRVGVLRD